MESVAGPVNITDSRQRLGILNLYVDRAGMAEVLERFERFIEEDKPHQVATANLQFLSLARKNRPFAELVNRADLVVADGMPLVWLSRLKGRPIASRITGHDLLLACAALASVRGHSIFLLGGAPGVADDAAKQLRAIYPGLKIEGTHHGHVSDAGEGERHEELAERIRQTRPKFLLVALGCPKQEFWIQRHMYDLGVPVCIGIGGTLDIFTGRLSRAPAWLQRCSLEWAYRLQQEPGRLWTRYILADLPTTLMATGEALSHRVLGLGRS